MTKDVQDKSLIAILNSLLKISQTSSSLCIKDILITLSGRGRLLILLFLSLPFCQPLQIPGLSTPFGLMIAFIGFRMSLGQRIWLPEKILSHRISANILQKLTIKIIRIVNHLKRFIYPRWGSLCDPGWMRKVNGFFIAFLGLFLALPLPIPLSNLVAGWALCLISLGLLEEDGVYVFLGYLVGLFSFLLLTVLVLFFDFALSRESS